MGAHVTYYEGGSTFIGYMGETGKPSAIARVECVRHSPYLVLEIPDAGARREGLRLELDGDLADAVAREMRRALTEFRKRTRGD